MWLANRRGNHVPHDNHLLREITDPFVKLCAENLVIMVSKNQCNESMTKHISLQRHPLVRCLTRSYKALAPKAV